MLNLSDKEIDGLSREAADVYEPEGSSLSWSRLEQKLSLEMPERPPDIFRSRRWSPYLWGSAAILVAGFSFFLIKNSFYSKYSTQTENKINTAITSSPELGGQKAPVSSDDRDSISASVKGDAVTTESQYAETVKAAAASGRRLSSGSAGKSDHDALSEKNRNELIGDGYSVNRKTRSKKLIIASSTTAAWMASRSKEDDNKSTNSRGTSVANDPDALNKVASGNKSAAGKNKTQMVLPLTVSSRTALGKISGNDSLLNAISKSKIPPPKSMRVNRSLNFGLAFGPDYTDAGGIANNQLGSNIGLTVGYYLTKKLSINTGIIYTNNFYWSPRKSPAPQMNNSGGLQPTYVSTFAAARAAPAPVEYLNGSNSLWEIPVTVRYDFASHLKLKFFANAGLSSYLIQKQTSIYFSHNGNTPLAWIKEDNNPVNYWFGVVNVSAGIEKDMGKGFSFQFEPYLKLPLKNMGMENLKLNSYGMLISIRYSPVLSRSKK